MAMAELAASASASPYFWYIFWCAAICFVSMIVMGAAKLFAPVMGLLIHIQQSRWTLLIIVEFLVSILIVERIFFQIRMMSAFWISGLVAFFVLSCFQLIRPLHCILIRRDKHGSSGGRGGWTKRRFLAFSGSKKCMAIVKVPLDAYIRRFERERLAMLRVTRMPNNPEVIDEGKKFMAMRRINGEDLYTWARRTMRDAAEELLEYAIVQIGIGSCSGFSALYDAGVLAHRDISPDNILVRIDGDMLTAIVIDYGTVKVTDGFEKAIPLADRPDKTPSLGPFGKPFFRCGKRAVDTVENDDVRALARTLAFPLIERHLLSGKGGRYGNIVKNGRISLVALEEHTAETGNLQSILMGAVKSDRLRSVLLAAENGEYAKWESPMKQFQSALVEILAKPKSETEIPELVTPVLVRGDQKIPRGGTPIMEGRHYAKSSTPHYYPASKPWLKRTLITVLSTSVIFLSVFLLMHSADGQTQYSPITVVMKEENSDDGPQEIAEQSDGPIHEEPPEEEAVEELETVMEVETKAEAASEVIQKEEKEPDSEQPEPEPSYWKLAFADAGEYGSVKVSYTEGEIEPERDGQRWEFRIPDDVSSVQVSYKEYKTVIPKSSAGILYLENYFQKSAEGSE